MVLDTAVATENAVTEANAAKSSNERQKRRRAAAAERGVDNDVLCHNYGGRKKPPLSHFYRKKAKGDPFRKIKSRSYGNNYI